MKPRTAKSMELYDLLVKRGYPEGFCMEITQNLNTDWTAQRMIGYLSHYKRLPMTEIVDEMLAILSDRNQIMEKKDLEAVNSRWNDFLNNGFGITCPVCGHYKFRGIDDREACHSCGWKNDQRQMEDPDWPDGENGMSLNEYRRRLTEWMML